MTQPENQPKESGHGSTGAPVGGPRTFLQRAADLETIRQAEELQARKKKRAPLMTRLTIALIVLGSLGTCAAIIIPNFLMMGCRSKHSEAKTNLKGIYVGMEMYFGEHGTWATTLDALDPRYKPSARRYAYALLPVGNRWVAVALGTEKSKATSGDFRAIGLDNHLVEGYNSCEH